MTLAIVVATYAAVAVGRVPLLRVGRSGAALIGAALIGAALLILTGAIGLRDAAAAIDRRTILLLLAMMIVVAPLQITGTFGRVIAWLSRRVHHPAALLAAIVLASGGLSAIFLNDTICVAFTPLVLELAAVRRREPLPYLLALATSSNIGSVATIVGNPQNILIGSVSGVSPWTFSAVLAPVALAGLALDVLIVWLIFRKQLTEPLAGHEAIDAAALPGRITPAAVARMIDWQLLFLFAGLFVVIGAIERAGIDRQLFAFLQPLRLRSCRRSRYARHGGVRIVVALRRHRRALAAER